MEEIREQRFEGARRGAAEMRKEKNFAGVARSKKEGRRAAAARVGDGSSLGLQQARRGGRHSKRNVSSREGEKRKRSRRQKFETEAGEEAKDLPSRSVA
jgi:hypothetical protein